MFARKIEMNLTPNNQERFSETMESDVLPMLRTQKGFQDGITFVSQDGATAVAISLWDRKESTDAYSGEGFPRLLKSLGTIIKGAPTVSAYDVSNSTWHKIAAHAPA